MLDFTFFDIFLDKGSEPALYSEYSYAGEARERSEQNVNRRKLRANRVLPGLYCVVKRFISLLEIQLFVH